MPQHVLGKRLPESVWGEPESCVKNDRKGAGTERMESPEDWVLSPNVAFCGGCSREQLPKPTLAIHPGKPIMSLHDGLRLGA